MKPIPGGNGGGVGSEQRRNASGRLSVRPQKMSEHRAWKAGHVVMGCVLDVVRGIRQY